MALAPLLLPVGLVGAITAAWRAETAQRVVAFWGELYASSTVHTLLTTTLVAFVGGLLVLMVSRTARENARHVLAEGMPGVAWVVFVAAILSWVASLVLHVHATSLFAAQYRYSFGEGPPPPPGSWRALGETSYALFVAGWLLFALWLLTWAVVSAARDDEPGQETAV